MSNDKQTPDNKQHHHHHANEELEALRSIFDNYARPAVIAVLLVTVIIIGVKHLQAQAEAKEQAAATLLANAASEADLETILNDYPKSKTAPLAMLALGRMHYTQARYPQAIEQYEQFTATYPEHEFVPVATLGELISRAAQTPSETIANELGAFVDAHPDHYLNPQAKLAKARCLRAIGKTEEARILLEDMSAAEDDEGWSRVAEEQLTQLETEIERKTNPMPVPEQPAAAPTRLPAAPTAGPVQSATGDLPAEENEPKPTPAE